MERSKLKSARWLALALIAFSLAFVAIKPQRAAEAVKGTKDERAAQIEAALYTRAEFFGAQAILPYPTGEARARLAEVARAYSQDAEIQLKLAELDEKLTDTERAAAEMLRYVELEKNSVASLKTLAGFYDRRARFADEAATLERMIEASPANERAEILRELIELARRHRLEKYQQPGFFKQLIASDPSAFEVVKQFIEHLIKEEDYAEALKTLRQHKAAFPDERDYFLEKEVEALVELKRGKEAEAVYVAAFDPFWTDEQSRKFYFDFLSERDRLRAYGREAKDSFRRNPANFDAAVRLYHYQHYDSEMNDDTATAIFTQLEKARAARNLKWKPEELATVARLLLANGDADAASRFLYTLHQAGGLQRGSELRAKVVYQIFELLIDANDQRTALTQGDLMFYEDVAKADPHPGMLGGVLSLVLADSDPQEKFESAEEAAVAHFNRASAYRVFNTFKQEYPTSPALAQMYLDLIRLHTSAKDTAVAAALLAEFDKRYSDAPQFAEVALKLADAYIATDDHRREREVYQRLLDHLGKQRKKDQPLVPATGSDEPSNEKPAATGYPPNTNYGYGISSSINTEEDNYRYYNSTRFRPVALNERRKAADEVTYSMVLARYVASLARENRAADVLALYSAEVKKYPEEQGLYEQMLQWLGQTNLAEEQLRVYQEAIKRFPTGGWTDRLARWYLRRGRQAEFEQFSRELLDRMNDQEVTAYLAKFVQSGADAKASTFDANLYLGLHRLAHERFPHNQQFATSLLRYYEGHKQWDDWRQLLAEGYFESQPMRQQYLQHLAANNKLREYAQTARGRANAIYKLFRADASVWLANFEEAVDAYRELNRLYPNTPEFAGRLVSLTRSFGQKDQASLEECAKLQLARANSSPASNDYRTQAGEVFAELGDYKRAAAEWERLLELGAGDEETWLETATIYWDYFQYDDALRVLKSLRRQKQDDTLYAFQIAAIYETQHKTREALTEYVKELHVHSRDYLAAKRRLKTLYAREGMPQQLRLALNAQLARTRDADERDGIVLGYAFLMNELEHWPDAAPLLRQHVARSNWPAFLNNAQELFSDHKDTAGELAALRRLAVVAKTERQRISYQLQLADHAASKGQKDAAAALLNQLLAKHPTNYGVLTEAADFYWRIGKREQAMRVLANAAQRSKGKYRYIFARKLAARQTESGQLAAAEVTLKKLYDVDPANLDVFNALAKLYVRQSKVDSLRERYRETIRAVKQTETDHLALRQTIAQLREQVIESFTQLRDYKSAIEQHIEIINRNPDDSEKVNVAVEYAKRYGGADVMIEYYTKTSQQAFKDYRWNLVLARLYDAKNDFANAKSQLRQAINNQPEMNELHSELADVSLRAKDYGAAIESLKLIVERTNDDPNYVKRLADAFDKAGRKQEAAAARAKLPVEKPKTQSISEQFAAANSLPKEQRAKAVETYRKAFDTFSKDFYKHELSAYELGNYVSAVREEEPLDQILRRLWEVRERIKRDSLSNDNLLAGKARALLETFDRTIPDAVGKVASEYATGDELAAIHNELKQRIATAGIQVNGQADADGTQGMLLNLSYRAGFNDLAERILIARKDAAAALNPTAATSAQTINQMYQDRLMTLVSFYSERGAYGRIIALTEQELAKNQKLSPGQFRAMIAEYARLTGDSGKELQALRAEFQSRTGNLVTSNDSLVERYLEALLENGEAGRVELQQAVKANTPHRFQFINFLLRKNELQLAREAIKAAPVTPVWESSRQAELSLAARDVNPSNDAYFLAALGWKTIGEMIVSKPDAARELIGDNWFASADSYGRWLSLSETSRQKSNTFLPAMLESRPKDAASQHGLGRWLLEQKQAQQAMEHLQLAAEMREGDKQALKAIRADIGSAHFEMGEEQRARDEWERIIKGEKPSVEDCQLYLRTLDKHGLAVEARAKLRPFVVGNLNDSSRESWRSDKKDFEQLKPLLRTLADSFGKADESGKAVFLRQLCEAAPKDVGLAGMAIRESLVARNQRAPFYEMLARRTEGFSSYASDSSFVELAKAHPAWSVDEIEEALDHAAGEATQVRAQSSMRENAWLDWQKEFLDYLIAERKNAEAAKLISAVEQEFKGRFARPAWLRLAKLRLEVRAGQVLQAVNGLKHFAGIEVSPRIDRVSPPKLEWLNQATEMLRREGQGIAADELLRAAYERQLALEQLDEAQFVGLARLQFAKGDAAGALKQLKLMLELAWTATHSTAAAELAALPQVKVRAVEAAWIEKPAANNHLSLPESLRLAAETAAEFGQFAAAIEYRGRLLEMSPDDSGARVELARTLAANKQESEAAKLLATVIADRRASRQQRWTAAWIAPEVVGQRGDVWQSLSQPVRDAGKDQEMVVALEALATAQRGQTKDAAKSVGEAAVSIPSNQLKLLQAVLLKRGDWEREALQSFASSLTPVSDSTAMAAFSSGEDELRWQLVRLYAKQNQPRASLKLAEADERLRGSSAYSGEQMDQPPVAPPRLLTLAAQSAERQRQSRFELLALLSTAAEQTGEFDKAADFERGRLVLLSAPDERQKAEARIEQLKAKQKEKANRKSIPLMVDERLLAAR
ncbi:MAG: tetratricopeptide repeat protein [Acidobacteriota bacterium]